MKGRRARWAVLGLGLVAAAVFQELRKPGANRTWRGHVLGVVPYDLRPLTWARLKGEWWNPADPRILTPHAFGVGWGVNLYQVIRQLRASLKPGFAPSASVASFIDPRANQ